MNLKAVYEACAVLEADLSRYALDNPDKPGYCQASQEQDQSIPLRVLTHACDLVRDTSPNEPDFYEIVERVNRTINIGIELVRRRNYRPLPSFAHSSEFPLLGGLETEKPAPEDTESCIFSEKKLPFREPWFTSPRAHDLSTPLSRFNWDFPGPSHPSLLANAVIQARCAISSEVSALPTAIAKSENCLMFTSLTGWKSRDPVLTYYLLDETDEFDFPLTARHAPFGLDEGYEDEFTAVGVDEVNKLLIAGDGSRAKTFAWGDRKSGEIYNRGRPTHTLSTPYHPGPISVFAPGRILRAGRGSIAFWNLDELETHGPEGNLIIGERYPYYHEEPSTGSTPTTIIQLTDPNFFPFTWHIHPNLPGNMLCASDAERPSPDFISVDLDTAKAAARYLGHYRRIMAFSTSDTDPQVFLTAAADGYVRLYDTRTPLPTLSLHADRCQAVLVHPDGIPMVFTGSSSEEVVKLWDIRASKMVYELSTGNNEVKGMAWDASRNVLYVSTKCGNVDKRSGRPIGYRLAEIPGEGSQNGDEYGEPETGSHDGDEMECGDFAWPCNASHTEDYFGDVFDAGEHRIFRYAFNDHANPAILPIYGTAQPDTYD
ncbi:hypothetical protein B0H11DRAFT_2018117 [Mycena galericulata]|nr:hypothetical protein B0H11DRAFT_2018117 [Mycena galericulata]